MEERDIFKNIKKKNHLLEEDSKIKYTFNFDLVSIWSLSLKNNLFFLLVFKFNFDLIQ